LPAKPVTLAVVTETPLTILAVVGSSGKNSVTRTVIRYLGDRWTEAGCAVDCLDLGLEPLTLFDPETTYQSAGYDPLKARVDKADVLVLGTPDYHGSISSTLKNFLDYFWKEFAGKLFATVVASHEKGLTVTDQLRTVARQCYAWTLPYGVSCADKEDVRDGNIVSDSLRKRLDMLVRDVRVYGALLASQRRADLAGQDPGFLARHRPH
jgi:azobenzene reductase